MKKNNRKGSWNNRGAYNSIRLSILDTFTIHLEYFKCCDSRFFINYNK